SAMSRNDSASTGAGRPWPKRAERSACNLSELDRRLLASPAELQDMADSPARTLFARFLSAARNGGGPEFEAFAADHPAQAPELRRLHAEWKAQASAPQPAETLPLTRRLTERFGEEVDPRVE